LFFSSIARSSAAFSFGLLIGLCRKMLIVFSSVFEIDMV
jgi:hypothetical protein